MLSPGQIRQVEVEYLIKYGRGYPLAHFRVLRQPEAGGVHGGIAGARGVFAFEVRYLNNMNLRAFVCIGGG